MINKLLDNCFLTELNTTVTDVEQEQNLYWYAFKETVFFRKQGGMASDIGVINGSEVAGILLREGGKTLKIRRVYCSQGPVYRLSERICTGNAVPRQQDSGHYKKKGIHHRKFSSGESRGERDGDSEDFVRWGGKPGRGYPGAGIRKMGILKRMVSAKRRAGV